MIGWLLFAITILILVTNLEWRRAPRKRKERRPKVICRDCVYEHERYWICKFEKLPHDVNPLTGRIQPHRLRWWHRYICGFDRSDDRLLYPSCWEKNHDGNCKDFKRK